MLRITAGAAALVLLLSVTATSQVMTVTPEGVGGHYLEFHPTNIPLPTDPLTERGKQELIRFLTAEQGFAMRPLPLGSKGLTLHANGDMQPSGSDYMNALNEKGTSAKAGDRCVISDVKIKDDKIILQLNGGPDHKHKWLRHVSIGMDPVNTNPVVKDDGQEPVGSRLTLVFPHAVPEVSGKTVEALLAPLLGFGLKSPVVAYTDTLPPKLKQAILDHEVLVGMSTEMVVYAMGQPQQKVREREGQMPFEEWIYGEAPKPVEFVRINGNRVIRVEVAEVGKPPVIRADNEMGDYWSANPAAATAQNVRTVKMGDSDPADEAKQNAPKAPPSLRLPGETLPTDDDKNHPVMGPVQFPTGTGTDSGSTQTKQQPSTPPQSSPQGTPSGSTPPQQYVAAGSAPPR
ncbi:hypothetical protein H7849_08470 [Alloacidobacterium dinghuense]|uniref:DUF4412 domain-containing protein n=1 Tax=Alloacidobacterium dinghuense TaxID=2763107 RepID=A0A7G8BN04_9BACT|nr:hypothetical protein [Alloacidobacterium dinghuense]QNI33924.1 hypothetical protein H7849_08470 [Alloacidobacterium dinghuense]